MLGSLRRIFHHGYAIDLGTANTLIYAPGSGIVLNEPSIVAVQTRPPRLLAVGNEAKKLYGKSHPNVETARPLKDGVIADFNKTNLMVRTFIKMVNHGFHLTRPTLVIGVPSGTTQVEKKAVIDAAMQASAKEVHLIEEPMAAAIGAKLPVHTPKGHMIVDIGGGTTEIAVISMFSTVYSESLRVAGDEMDEAIARYIRKRYGLQIGIFEAEKLKILLGSAVQLPNTVEMPTIGRDVIEGVPREFRITDKDIFEALQDPVNAIVESVLKGLSYASPEIAGDIMENGVVLAGGGSLLRNLHLRIHKATGLKVARVKSPLIVVVLGAGAVLENFGLYKQTCIV
jgi:rod shape-determining protein MreB